MKGYLIAKLDIHDRPGFQCNRLVYRPRVVYRYRYAPEYRTTRVVRRSYGYGPVGYGYRDPYYGY